MNIFTLIRMIDILKSEMISRGSHSILIEIGVPGNYVDYKSFDLSEEIAGIRYQSLCLGGNIDVSFERSSTGYYFLSSSVSSLNLIPSVFNYSDISINDLFIYFRHRIVEVSEFYNNLQGI